MGAYSAVHKLFGFLTEFESLTPEENMLLMLLKRKEKARGPTTWHSLHAEAAWPKGEARRAEPKFWVWFFCGGTGVVR